MSNDEGITNDQMTKQSRSHTSGFGFRHSFVIRHSCFVILVALIAGIGTAFAEKRAITEKDLFDFVWIGDPQVSPDGSRVAFVRVTVNEKKEGYNTSIWTVPLEGGGEPRQLTKGDHDSVPRWSPDGKFLLFLRATEKNGKPEPPQLAILSMTGGDSFVFTDLPKGAGNPSWAPKRKNQKKKNQKKRAVGMLPQAQMSTRAMFASSRAPSIARIMKATSIPSIPHIFGLWPRPTA